MYLKTASYSLQKRVLCKYMLLKCPHKSVIIIIIINIIIIVIQIAVMYLYKTWVLIILFRQINVV